MGWKHRRVQELSEKEDDLGGSSLKIDWREITAENVVEVQLGISTTTKDGEIDFRTMVLAKIAIDYLDL